MNYQLFLEHSCAGFPPSSESLENATEIWARLPVVKTPSHFTRALCGLAICARKQENLSLSGSDGVSISVNKRAHTEHFSWLYASSSSLYYFTPPHDRIQWFCQRKRSHRVSKMGCWMCGFFRHRLSDRPPKSVTESRAARKKVRRGHGCRGRQVWPLGRQPRGHQIRIASKGRIST